ncbi:hypothetical protein GCM10022243_38230 [Saccharothrix violaceirubra]|uniref:Tetratricopeptide (TPR) repeat protein n=1 Tax=Saccharothrix violaceirubra TaxID=413306 RepID=A0A7W7T479_9PSEU|nr:hypothetical protein [Saccharothrix violaceirubra]MBB4966263.1 tetratricopeptide (TPR) repeat protein [Saccharothrix violaceirubra]
MNDPDDFVEEFRRVLDRNPVPGGVQLTVALSLATRIEPELVRAVRVRVLPHLDVGAESDFWFGPWIGARRPHVVTLRQDLLSLLWETLRRWHGDRTYPHLGRLGEVVDRVHRDQSPAFRLEEEVRRLTYLDPGGAEAAGRVLRRATRAIADDGDPRFLGWLAGARRRLPAAALDTTDGWHLLLVAGGHRPEKFPDRPSVDGLKATGRVAEVLGPPTRVGPGRPPDLVGLGRQGDDLVIGGEAPVMLPLPAGIPPAVEVLIGDDVHGEWHSLDGPLPPGLGRERVRLRTVDGSVFEVPRRFGDSVRESPVLVRIEHTDGRPASYWLQPVRSASEHARSSDQPVGLLAKVLGEVAHDHAASARLVEWRDDHHANGMLVLYGRDENDRVRVAWQLAVDSERQGWAVYRGRQDPESAWWLTEDRQDCGAANVLLVVDRADSWQPRHLPLLRDGVRTSGRVRVLLLADDAGSWWQGVESLLSKTDCPGSGLRLADRAPTRPGPDLRDLVVRAITDLRRVDRTELVRRVAWLDSGTGLEVGAVAACLDVEAGSPVSTAPPGTVVLRHEHAYRRRLPVDPERPVSAEALAELVFLGCLMAPLARADARSLLLHRGVIDDDAGWFALLGEYGRRYLDDQEHLDPLGPVGLAEDLLAAVLLDGDKATGVDPEAARELVARLGDDHVPVRAAANALTVLSRAGKRWPRLLVDHVHPLARRRPESLVAAGGPALLAALRHADVDLLERLRRALPPATDRPVGLDVAVAELEERLVEHGFRQGRPGPHRDAPLHLRLAASRRLAGRLAGALDSARRAVEEYDRLVPVDLRRHTEPLCEALVLLSRLLGETGQPKEALERAEHADARLRRLISQSDATAPNSLIGRVLATLARERARQGDTPLAVDDARRAVEVLRELDELRPGAHRADLVDALSTLVDLSTEVDARGGMAYADEAVAMADELVAKNEWAHLHRIAAARLSRARFLDDREALDETESAVAEYRRVVSASPARFEGALGAALVRLARRQNAVEPQVALLTAQEAVGLCRKARFDGDRTTALIDALEQLAAVCRSNERRTDAIKAAAEAAGLLRGLGAVERAAELDARYRTPGD